MKKLRGVIIMVVCVGLCVGYYFYLSNRSISADAPTEMEQLINKDLDKSYPKTAREVIRLYNRILLCLYNEEVTEEQLKSLGEQARQLMDEELLEKNPQELYFSSLKNELAAYKADKKTIMGVTISTVNEVEFKEIEGRECAYVEASYSIKGKNQTESAQQTYILRKSAEGRWKILGYYQS